MFKFWKSLAAAGLIAAVGWGCGGGGGEEPVAVQMTPEQEAFMRIEMERQQQRLGNYPPPPGADEAPQAPAP